MVRPLKRAALKHEIRDRALSAILRYAVACISARLRIGKLTAAVPPRGAVAPLPIGFSRPSRSIFEHAKTLARRSGAYRVGTSAVMRVAGKRSEGHAYAA